jgi:hypothetical protein
MLAVDASWSTFQEHRPVSDRLRNDADREIRDMLLEVAGEFGLAEGAAQSLVWRILHLPGVARVLGAAGDAASISHAFMHRMAHSTCSACEGSGVVDRGDHDALCLACGGAGTIIIWLPGDARAFH